MIQMSCTLSNLGLTICDDRWEFLEGETEDNQTFIIELFEEIVDGGDGSETNFIVWIIEEIKDFFNVLVEQLECLDIC